MNWYEKLILEECIDNENAEDIQELEDLRVFWDNKPSSSKVFFKYNSSPYYILKVQ